MTYQIYKWIVSANFTNEFQMINSVSITVWLLLEDPDVLDESLVALGIWELVENEWSGCENVR